MGEKGTTISQKAFVVSPEGNITLTTEQLKGEEQGVSRAEPQRRSRQRHAEGVFTDLPKKAASTPMEKAMQEKARQEEEAKKEGSWRGMKLALEKARELGLTRKPPLQPKDEQG